MPTSSSASSSSSPSTDLRLAPASELQPKTSCDEIQVDDCVSIAATISSDANCNAKEVKSQVVEPSRIHASPRKESEKEAASDGQNDAEAPSERKVASPSTPRKEAEETRPTESAPIGGRKTSTADSHPNMKVDIQAQANTCHVKIQLSNKAALGIALGDNKASGMPVLKEVKPLSPLRGKIPAEFVGSSIIQSVAIQGRRFYPQLATECVRMIQEAQVLPPHRGWPLTIEMSLERKNAAVPDELRAGKRSADTEDAERARLVTSEVKRTAIPGAAEEAATKRSPSNLTKQCPKCGKDHVNACGCRQKQDWCHLTRPTENAGNPNDVYLNFARDPEYRAIMFAQFKTLGPGSKVYVDDGVAKEVLRVLKKRGGRIFKLRRGAHCSYEEADDMGALKTIGWHFRNRKASYRDWGGNSASVNQEQDANSLMSQVPTQREPRARQNPKRFSETVHQELCCFGRVDGEVGSDEGTASGDPVQADAASLLGGEETLDFGTSIPGRKRHKPQLFMNPHGQDTTKRSSSNLTKQCPKCGMDFNARGYHNHVNACRRRRQTQDPWCATLKGRGCVVEGCTKYKKARAGGYCLGCYKDRNEGRSPEDAYLSVTNDAEAALESSFEQMLDQAILQSETESTYLDFKDDPRYKSIMYAKFKEMGRGTNVDESVVDDVLQQLKKRGGRIFKRGVPRRRAHHRKVVKAEYEEADDTVVAKAISGHLRNRNGSYQKWGDGSVINLVTPQCNSTLANKFLEVSRSKRKRQKPQNFMEAQSQEMLVREELVKQRRETGVRGIKPFSVNENRAFEQGCIAHGWGNWVLIVNQFLPQRTTKECRTHAAMITERHPEIRERLMEEYNGTWANYNRAPKKKAKRTTDGAAQCTKTNARKGHGAAEVVAKRSPSDLTKQCPKCGEDFHSKGYHSHINACGRRRKPQDVTPPRAIQSQPEADGKIAMTCPHCLEVKRCSPKTAAASFSNHTKACAQKKKEASETYRASNSAGKPPSSTSRERLQSIPIFKQRMRIRKAMRLKVRFVDKRGGVKWYPGAIDKVLSRGRKIKIYYDDGTEETAAFPDEDILVEGLQGTSTTRRSKRKGGVSKPSVIKLPNKKKATRVDVQFAKGRRWGKMNDGCRPHKGRHQTIPSVPDFYAVETLPERLALAKAELCENLGVGWTVKVVPRKDVADGATRHDKYYFSPEGERFLSMAEARRYTKQRNRSEAIKASWKRRKKELAAKEQARDARRQAANVNWAKLKGKRQQRTSRSEAMKASWKRRKRELAKKEQAREAKRQARRQAAKKGWATRKGQKQQWAKNEELQQMHFRQTQVGKDSESHNEASRIGKRKAPPAEVDSVASLRAELEKEKRKVKKLKDSLEEVRGDLDVAKETVEHQLLATDRWQGRFDELARRAESGPVNGAVIAELRSRSLANAPPPTPGARFRKIKVGRISGFPVVVKQGRGRHEAIIVECDEDPEQFIARHSGQEVKIRWKIAGYDDFVLANDVRLLGGNTVW